MHFKIYYSCNIQPMKKIILFFICLYIMMISFNNEVFADQLPYSNEPICHSFLGIQFIGTVIATWGLVSLGSSSWFRYSSGVKFKNDCSNADTKYYSFLIAIFSILSGIWYFGYKKYKAKKIITHSNTDS